MINLGNVVGVVRGANPPLEEDGVTEKRYVLWAKIITTSPETYDINYYDTSTSAWVSFSDKIDQRTAVQINNLFKTDDADTVINTLGEIIQAFEDLPEGNKKVADLLAKKLDVIYVFAPPLQTQGKVGDVAVNINGNDIYIKGRSGSTEEWVKMPAVINTLTSTSTTDALSAARGKRLADILDEKPDIFTSNATPGTALGKVGDMFIDTRGDSTLYIKRGFGAGSTVTSQRWVAVPLTVNNLTSTSTVDALSASMGKKLSEDKATTHKVQTKPLDNVGKAGDIAVDRIERKIYIKKDFGTQESFFQIPTTFALGGAPNNTNHGTVGDIAFDTSGSGSIYIKRRFGSTETWTRIPYSTSEIYTGSGYPPDSLGKIGDIYLDTTTIYMKRQSAGVGNRWVVVN